MCVYERDREELEHRSEVTHTSTQSVASHVIVAVYEQARAMAVDNIGRMRKRDSSVPRYDWSACITLRILMITFSEMQSNLLHSITMFNTGRCRYVILFITHLYYYHIITLTYHTIYHTHLYCYYTIRLISILVNTHLYCYHILSD